MPYDYNPAVDLFYLREGVESSPKSMEDCYNGDKAGSFANHTRTGITGTDASPVAVDYALKPADYVVLGGASNDLWILIVNWAGFVDVTIRIIGTDRDGNAQTEDVVVNGNGTYYTAKWFKTVTDTQVVAVNGAGSFDYKLEQGQYGAISKISTKCYVVHSNFYIWYYGSYTGALALEDVNVVFEKYFRTYYASAYLRLGQKLNGRGVNGAKVVVLGAQDQTYGKMYVYGSVCNLASRTQGNEVIDSVMLAGQAIATVDDILERVTLYSSLVYNIAPTTDPKDILIHNAVIGVFYGVGNGRVKNLTFRSCIYDIYNYFNRTCYYRDCDWNRAKIHSGSNGIILDEYTINLKVTSKNGAGVAAVSVKAYKNGDYTGLDPNGGATPVIDTTTDGNGKIPEQGLVIWEKNIDGGVTTDYNPFLWILEHADYPTKKFIMTMPRRKLEDGDWVYAYAEETTGSHEQILSAISKHDKKLTGLVA